MKYLAGLCCSSLLALGGCANQAVMSETAETQVTVSKSTVEVVSVPEDFQNFIMRGNKICAMSTPPATFGDTGPSLDLTAGVGSEKIDTGSITASSTNLGDTTYLLDQLLYRLCEIGISYDLSKSEFLEFYLKTLEIADELGGKNYDSQVVEALLEGAVSEDGGKSDQ